MAAAKKKTIEIEAFEDDDELDEDESEAEALVAAEKLAAEDNDEDDDSDDDEDDEDDDEDNENETDEDEDPELAQDTENKFAPHVFLGDGKTTWKLEGLFNDVDDGETIYIYDVANEVFYKLQPVEVGEIGQ